MALVSYLWGSGNLTSPVGMTSTTFFNDFSVGDKTTFRSVATGVIANPAPQITGMIDFDPGFTFEVTAFTCTYGAFLPNGGVNIASHSNTLRVEYYDGSVWTLLGTDTNSSLGPNDLNSADFTTYTPASFPAVQTRRLRAYVAGNLTMVVPGTPIALAVGISDFRYTGLAYANMEATGLIDIFAGAREQEAQASGTMIPSGSGETDNGCIRLRERAGATTSRAAVVDCVAPTRKVKP